jgi:long-chain acyl-CoA synthetase
MEERIWHKAYVPQVPRSLDLENITMPEVLARTAQKYPDRTSFIFMGRKISYAELDKWTDRFANGLRDIGVKAGDRVALILPNIPQIIIAYFAVWRLGATPVPNNPLYTDRELLHQLNDSGVTTVITLDLLADRILALKPQTKIKAVVSCHINDYLPFPIRQLFPILKKTMYRKYTPAPDFYQFTDMMKSAAATLEWTPPPLDEMALIPYTGGTTGVSKGVVLTHRNVTSIIQQMSAWFYDWEGQHKVELAAFPFFHLAGFTAVMNLSVWNGWTAVLVPKPEPQTIMDTILKYKTNVILAVPTLYVGIMALPEFKKADLSFVEGFFSGAAPLPLEVINGLKAATGADIVEGFGMTESTAMVTITPWRGVLKPGSVGVPIPNTEIKLVDVETGEKEVALGEEGEIVFRGPQMCQGYYNMPSETAQTLRNGWFHTGDIGTMDEDGYLYIVDRKKDMIIAGGFNIFPREIDEVLYEHPKVLEACTVGVPDEYRGETVKAFVVAKPGQTITPEELDAFCRERLTPYKVPKKYEFMDELPKSAIGKVLRRELRDMDAQKNANQ